MLAAATRTGPSPSASAERGGDRPSPDPLDDAAYDFPPTGTDPYPYARFGGHLPALRLPPPRPGGLLTRVTARQAMVVWSVLDLWAFVAALRLGPGPLAPVALAGSVATCWHLRDTSRRRTSTARTTEALSTALTALAPLGAAASRRGRGRRGRPQLHTTFSPRGLRRRLPLLGTRRLSDWWPATLPPALLVVAGSMVAGAVVHAALAGAGPLH